MNIVIQKNLTFLYFAILFLFIYVLLSTTSAFHMVFESELSANTHPAFGVNLPDKRRINAVRRSMHVKPELQHPAATTMYLSFRLIHQRKTFLDCIDEVTLRGTNPRFRFWTSVSIRDSTFSLSPLRCLNLWYLG